jgi:hypothetical protein
VQTARTSVDRFVFKVSRLKTGDCTTALHQESLTQIKLCDAPPNWSFDRSRQVLIACFGTSLYADSRDFHLSLSPELQGFGQMVIGDPLRCSKVGDRACDAQHPIVSACGERQSRNSGGEHLPGRWIERRCATKRTSVQTAVQLALPLQLTVAR